MPVINTPDAMFLQACVASMLASGVRIEDFLVAIRAQANEENPRNPAAHAWLQANNGSIRDLHRIGMLRIDRVFDRIDQAIHQAGAAQLDGVAGAPVEKVRKKDKLIDSLVKIFSRPLGGSGLAANQIQQIRDALLSDDEKADVDTKELDLSYCTACGITIIDRSEPLVIVRQHDSVLAYCIKCLPTEVVPCATNGCHEKASGRFPKNFCHACNTKRKETGAKKKAPEGF